ncbi:MAG: cupin domain-containing protein [Thermoleophilia bacterium]|nr:cupin domain-containing protein [Thermoleophilia bacterium]
MADVRYFTHIDEVSFVHNTEIADGSEKDEGVFKELISAATGSRDLNLGIGWLKPGEVHILHHHPVESEFYYFVEGEAVVTVNDQTERVSAGSAVHIPAGATHKIVNDGDTTAVVLFGYDHPTYSNIWDE